MKVNLAIAISGIILATAWVAAQTPESGQIPSFTATTANVGGAPDSIRIELLRWSTDAERQALMSAWNMTGGEGRAVRGGGQGRGGGRAGRGGRGGRGAEAADAPPPTPEGSLAAALQTAPTDGYLWSSEIAGYAIRYAGKVAMADGGERVILITDRRLGNTNDLWTLPGGVTPAPRDFSVIELRLNAKGEGEGRVSITGKLSPDSAAKIVAAENYDALPVVLKNVKPHAGSAERQEK
jgi:hypothetical protein